MAAGKLTTQDEHDHATEALDNDISILGLVADRPALTVQPYYLWPENLRTWNIWQRLQSQWRISMNGRDGLDYAGVCTYLREVARVRPRHFTETFHAIQAMESAALETWAQAKE